jgi:hypothetical protein
MSLGFTFDVPPRCTSGDGSRETHNGGGSRGACTVVAPRGTRGGDDSPRCATAVVPEADAWRLLPEARGGDGSQRRAQAAAPRDVRVIVRPS